MSWDPRRLLDREPLPRAVAVAALVAFVAVTLFVALHHEQWRDEADPWLRVRDGDFRTIVLRGRYTGYPLLWHLLILPMARSGLPYVSQTIFHLTIAAVAVALLLWRLPLGWTTRLLAAFSYFFAYEYSVIARASAPAILLAFVAAAMHRQRETRPIAYAVVLAILFNVSAQGFLIAAGLAVAFLVTPSVSEGPGGAGGAPRPPFLRRPPARPLPHGRGDRIAAVAIMAAAAFASWLQVRTPPDPSRIGRPHFYDLPAFRSMIGDAFFPTAPLAIGFIAGVIVLGALTLAIHRSRAALVVLGVPFLGFTILYGCIWYGGVRHAGFLLVAVLLALAVADDVDHRYATAAALLLNVALVVSVGIAARTWFLDTTEAYSGAQEMAAFIRERGLERVDIAAHSAQRCEAVLPYLPGKKFWYPGIEAEGSFMEWDAAYERGLDVPYDVAEGRARRHFAGRPWLLLLTIEMPDPPARGFRLLYTNRRPIFEKTDERFWLYTPDNAPHADAR